MAPFNQCSCCQVRTRKVIRDRTTRKNIYVCPTCYKTRKYLQNNNQTEVQPEEDEVFHNVDQENDVPDDPLEHQENEGNTFKNKPPKHQEIKIEAQKGKGNFNENVRRKMLQKDVFEEIPQTCITTNTNSSPKITPPLMEIVVINNRKYIAVSVTADAE